MKQLRYLLQVSIIFSLITSCTSYEQFQQLAEESEIPSQLYKNNYNQTWQSVLEIMQKYDLSLKNQEAGVIKTRWIDNTNQLNFNEAFGSQDMVKAARFKIIVNVVKGYRGTREVAKVSVFKRQMIEKDFLQGWKVVRSDGILEKTILYRVDRILKREKMIKDIETRKAKEEEASF